MDNVAIDTEAFISNFTVTPLSEKIYKRLEFFFEKCFSSEEVFLYFMKSKCLELPRDFKTDYVQIVSRQTVPILSVQVAPVIAMLSFFEEEELDKKFEQMVIEPLMSAVERRLAVRTIGAGYNIDFRIAPLSSANYWLTCMDRNPSLIFNLPDFNSSIKRKVDEDIRQGSNHSFGIVEIIINNRNITSYWQASPDQETIDYLRSGSSTTNE